MLMAGGMPVVVPCDFGAFEGFGILGIGGFGCPTVFVGFDFFLGLASLDLRRVSKAFARKLAVGNHNESRKHSYDLHGSCKCRCKACWFVCSDFYADRKRVLRYGP